MRAANGVEVPVSLEELCDPASLALLVYDMQVGIVGQLPDGVAAVESVATVLEAARRAGVAVFFCRHTSLPTRLMGSSQLRTAMAWQRLSEPGGVRSLFSPGEAGVEIVAELRPREDEAVFDKLGMSMFEGTPLDMALRDLGIRSFAIIGAVLEIGIEPTVRDGGDLGYVPIIVSDACASMDDEARMRSLSSLDYALMSVQTDVSGFTAALGASTG